MNLVLEKTICSEAFAEAVSPDGLTLAVAGERKVVLYRLKDLSVISIIRIANPNAMVFLSDNQSLFILNTTGSAFLWNGTTLACLCKRKPFFADAVTIQYIRDDCILCGNRGGLWRYDVIARKVRQLYKTSRMLQLCSCTNGILRCILFDSEEAPSSVRLLQLTDDGKPIKSGVIQLPHRYSGWINKCVWTDSDRIFISFGYAVARTPSEEPPSVATMEEKLTQLLPKEVLSQDLVEMLAELGTIFAGRESRSALCVADADGNLLQSITDSGNDGNLYDVGSFLVKSEEVGTERVVFYERETLEQVCCLDRDFFMANGEPNPPTFVRHTPDGRLLIGSWSRLYVFRIQPEDGCLCPLGEGKQCGADHRRGNEDHQR